MVDWGQSESQKGGDDTPCTKARVKSANFVIFIISEIPERDRITRMFTLPGVVHYTVEPSCWHKPVAGIAMTVVINGDLIREPDPAKAKVNTSAVVLYQLYRPVLHDSTGKASLRAGLCVRQASSEVKKWISPPPFRVIGKRPITLPPIASCLRSQSSCKKHFPFARLSSLANYFQKKVLLSS